MPLTVALAAVRLRYSMTKTKPSYTELNLAALLERMESRLRRLEDLINEQGTHKALKRPNNGFDEWWGKLEGYSADAKYVGDVSVYKSAALEIWKAALNWRKK